MADSVKAAIAKALAEHGVTLSDEELAKVAKVAKAPTPAKAAPAKSSPAKSSSSKTTAKGKN